MAEAAVPNTALPGELSNEEINGVRLEKALELGTKVYRDEFHKTFPKDPVKLYEALQKEKYNIQG